MNVEKSTGKNKGRAVITLVLGLAVIGGLTYLEVFHDHTWAEHISTFFEVVCAVALGFLLAGDGKNKKVKTTAKSEN